MDKMEQKPYKGYLVIPRGIILPFLGKPIRLIDLGAFIAIVIECDWDKKHPTYGCLLKSDTQLAERWGCAASTVWRYKRKLLTKGLLVDKGGQVKVKHFELFEIGLAKRLANTPIATSQDLFANVQSIVANPHEDIASMQDNQAQNMPQSSNVSFKGDLSLSNDEYESFSDEELDRIAKEIDEMRSK